MNRSTSWPKRRSGLSGRGNRSALPLSTLTDRKKSEKGVVTARLLNRNMEPLVVKHWKVPMGAAETNPPEMVWDIPSDTPESYFFLELTLDGLNGKRLSRSVYWERVLKSLADPAERKNWQAEPVPEPVCKTGPWLKPQIAACQTALSGGFTAARRRPGSDRHGNCQEYGDQACLSGHFLRFAGEMRGDLERQLFLAGCRRNGYDHRCRSIGHARLGPNERGKPI